MMEHNEFATGLAMALWSKLSSCETELGYYELSDLEWKV
jgi:hypothetical protein